MTPPECSFHELAEAEFNDALEYYRRIDPTVAAEFITEVEKALGFIVM